MVGALNGGVVVHGCVAALLGEPVADVARNRAAGAVVAALLDPLLQRLDRRRLRVVLNRRRLRDRVCVHAGDARTVCQYPLDDGLLGGVVEIADVQDRRRLATGPVVRAVLVDAHRYLVLVKRSTAARSSSLFAVAVFASPEASASWTQWVTWSFRISKAMLSSAVL